MNQAVVTNKFTIEMEAAENLKFTYEFRDNNGVLLYTETFSLKKKASNGNMP
jgi:hypothetical protein